MTPVDDEDVIGIGEGIMITAASDFTVTFAGEVVAGAPTVVAPAGFSMIGCPTPSSVKIADILVKNALGMGTDSAQKVNADGSWGSMYYYNTLEGSGWLADGWYKEDGMTPVDDDDVLAAGESLMISAAQEMKLTFPAVIQK